MKSWTRLFLLAALAEAHHIGIIHPPNIARVPGMIKHRSSILVIAVTQWQHPPAWS